ncbi:hypothetical protein Tco_0805108 [Tanacetum coccineum]
MASDHVSSDLVSQYLTTALEHDSLSPGHQSQENVPHSAEIVTTSNELNFLFSPMFDELLNGTTQVVSKSSAVNVADAPDKPPTQAPTVTATENINQAETNKEYAQVKEDEIINIFSTPVQERGETSSRHVDSSNMHTFYQRHPSEHHWTKDHTLEQHGMTSCDSICTPMTTKHLDADLSRTLVDQMKYRSMVRALMYLTASRPDIIHETCYCARYQARPTEKHLTAIRISGACFNSRKSTSGGIQFLCGDKLVSWSSKKQDCTSMSSAKAEYVSLSACCTQVLWLRT